MTRTQYADRAAVCFAAAIVAAVLATRLTFWPALALFLLCVLSCRWGVARVILAVEADRAEYFGQGADQ